jgi:TolA-binding protein
MIRKGTTVAGALSALLVLGIGGAAAAQSDLHPRPTGTAQDSPSADHHLTQQMVDQEKAALKDQLQPSIDAASGNIDALKKMSQNETGQTKKQHEGMEKQLSDMRDRLKDDLGKVSGASLNDWKSVRTSVEHDLDKMDAKLHRLASITGVTPPQPGAASKQPQGR